jgi:hypothetical protein
LLRSQAEEGLVGAGKDAVGTGVGGQVVKGIAANVAQEAPVFVVVDDSWPAGHLIWPDVSAKREFAQAAPAAAAFEADRAAVTLMTRTSTKTASLLQHAEGCRVLLLQPATSASTPDQPDAAEVVTDSRLLD